ncbi:MAG: hypothetical protein ACRDQW_15430 [Haloechinothrix sp.]
MLKMNAVRSVDPTGFFTYQNPDAYHPDWKGFYESALERRKVPSGAPGTAWTRSRPRTRSRLLAEVAESGVPILPSHFAYPSAGRVIRAGTGYTFQPPVDIFRAGQYVRPQPT